MTERRIDYAGIATVSGGLVAILLGLDQAVDWGWTDAAGAGDVRRSGSRCWSPSS